MAVNLKVSELTALATPDAADLLPIVDVSDTTDAASGTTKKITHANLVAGLGGGGATVVSSTVTGAQNNYAPTLSAHTLINWSGASDAAFTGIAGGSAGMLVTIKNTGTKIVTFAHNSGSSSAGNKLFNLATSAPTPVAAGGWITYQHDGTQWQLVDHEQGAWITPTFAAGNFTAGSGAWTVEAGDVASFSYRLRGFELLVFFSIGSSTTSLATASVIINKAAFGNFTPSATPWTQTSVAYISDDNYVTFVSGRVHTALANSISIAKLTGNIAASTNNLALSGMLIFPVT